MADFTMYVGDTKVLKVTVLDEDGNAVNITGVDIRWWMAKNVKKLDADVLIKKSTTDGISITDGPNGKFEVTIEPEDTETLKAGSYYHEAEVDDAGVISTVMTGKATLTPTLVKPEP